MTTTSEIWLDFLDVDAGERRPLGGEITKQVNPAGNGFGQLCAQKNTYWPLFRCLHAPETSSTPKVQDLLRGGRKIVDCLPAKHSDEDHMVPVVAMPGAVNRVHGISTGRTHRS